MHIDMVVKNTRLGNYARERVEHKLVKTMERFYREIPVRVSLEEKKGTFKARVMSSVNGKEVLSHSESRSKLEALDEAVGKFDRQLLKMTNRKGRKSKVRGPHRNANAMSEAVVQEAEDDVAARIQSDVYVGVNAH